AGISRAGECATGDHRLSSRMAKKRVHEIAKERGITSKEALEVLRAAGLEVKVAASSVEEEDAARAFGNGAAAAPAKAAKPRADAKRAKADGKAASAKTEAAPAADAEAKPASGEGQQGD